MKKVISLVVLLMLAISVVPAVFADEDTNEPVIIDASSGRVGVRSMDDKTLVPVFGLRPMKTTEIMEGPEIAVRIENGIDEPVRKIGESAGLYPIDDVQKTERKRHIDGLINKNKGQIVRIFNSLKNNYDEKKAIRFVTFATHVNERAIDTVDGMIERAGNSETFMKSHPDAIESMEEIKEDLMESYEVFYNAISDNALPEEEYYELVDDLREFGAKLKNFSQNKDVRSYVDNHRSEIAKNLRERYGDNKMIRERIQELENARTSSERMRAMESVRISVEELHDEDSMDDAVEELHDEDSMDDTDTV